MQKYFLVFSLFIISLWLFLGNSYCDLYDEQDLEEAVYKYLSIMYIDVPCQKDLEWEKEQFKPLRAKSQKVIPLLLKVLEDSSTQHTWIERLETESKEGYSRAQYTIITRAMESLPQMSTDTAIMERLYNYVTKLLNTGTTRRDIYLIHSGIDALAKDTSDSGLQRVVKLRQEINENKYSFQNFEKNADLKSFEAYKTPENIRKYIDGILDKRIQTILEKRGKAPK